jgi:hypothetical protein
MKSSELIHAEEDVRAVLRVAHEIGLCILVNQPTEEAKPRFLGAHEIPSITKGQFQLFRDRWVYSDFQYTRISGGIHAEKYFVHGRTNFAMISTYFSGERTDGNKPRLGGGVITWYRDFLKEPEDEMRLAPDETKDDDYKRIAAAISSGRRVRGGKHAYIVCKAAAEKAKLPNVLPPFDYILFEGRSLR